MTSELKPCPFCGSARATVTSECDMDTDGKFYRIECLDCKAKTKEHYAVETCPIFYESVRNDWNTRASPSVDSHPCNTKEVECQKIQNLEHKTELENIIQDAVNKTLAQPKYRRGQYIIEDSELQKYATPSADTLAGLVRYDTPYDFNGKPIAGMVPVELGEYVLYSEAVTVIDDLSCLLNDKQSRIDHLEAELAQSKDVEQWNTRATPPTDTLAGLVRYDHSQHNMVRDPDGYWCKHHEAATVVDRLQVEASKHAHDAETVRRQRDEEYRLRKAAEAEPDKLKAQEPVGWFHFCISTGEYTAEWCRVKPYDHHGFRPLYAAPVSDSLKAASKTLVGILTNALNDEDVNCGSVAGGYLCGDAMSDAIAEVRAALNVEASPLAPEGGRE